MGNRDFSQGVEEAIAVTFLCGDELLSKFLARYSCIRIKKDYIGPTAAIRKFGYKLSRSRWWLKGTVEKE